MKTLKGEAKTTRNFGKGWKEIQRYERNTCRRHKMNNCAFVLGVIVCIIAISAFTGMAQ